MSDRELRLSHLVGRRVCTATGRNLGRIEELFAQIELHEHRRDYVVTEFHVGDYGILERLGGSHFARHALRRFGGATRYRVKWELMDLSDPEHPRVRAEAHELPTIDE